ncbi:hypothetical protein ANCCAN_18544 [Ancylostoma caninum]|uniref:Uncharacterized protein n=1 Tax=Ancylostoma caninum TaxID=29170 RepID=A0A368FTP0_ANCCA|nr:hypothetical protein ANCCAN_18544 [Ancylostoma caninum]
MYSKSSLNPSKSPQRRYVVDGHKPLPPVKYNLFPVKTQSKQKQFHSLRREGKFFLVDAPPKLEKPAKIPKLDAKFVELPALSPVDDFCIFERTRTPSPSYLDSPSWLHSPSWLDIPSDHSRIPSPTGSSVSSSSCPSVVIIEPPRRKPFSPEELQSRKRFKGERQVSLRGKHGVLVYQIPGTEDAYVFCHDRTNAHYQIFQCVHCWEFKKVTPILVIGDEFLEDPDKLDHCCLGTNMLEDRVKRLTHKWLMELREESKFCKSSPREEYENFLKWLRDESDEDTQVRKKMLKIFKESGGYSEHRKLFARFCKPKKTAPKSFVEKYIPQPYSRGNESGEECLVEFDDSFHPEKMGTMELLKAMTGIDD